MAEIIVPAILVPIIETLTSAVIKKLALSKGIHQPLEEWEGLLSQIQGVLSDAAQREIVDESVKQWLNDLRHLVYDIEDVLDTLATKVMERELTKEFGGSTSKLRNLGHTWFTGSSRGARAMNDKLNNITAKLRKLEQDKNTFGLTVKDGKSNKTNREETCLVDASSSVGRQGDEEALLQKLLEEEPSKKYFTIVPIVGLGGIGKTFLAQLLYNDEQVKDRFDLMAWVCVSDEFDIPKITKAIFQSVAGENKEFADLNQLQVALQERLSGKRFLLVLDDVWTESYKDWKLLERPFLVGAPGSKIIMTTRKMQLLAKLGFDQPYNLQKLSDKDALSLFSQQALGENNLDSHPTLKPHGEGIVKKCDGLPLALIALGRLLRTKPNEEEWEDLLNSEIWKLQDENDIIPALRLSYHDLPQHLKQLFAYCSLFPKDYVFNKDGLVLLWMAEGFLLHPSGTNTSDQQIESIGRKYFEQLLSRSFFQQVPNEESLYVMHDLMNDLATFVAEDFFLRLNDEVDKDVPDTTLKKYRHMSFTRKTYEVYERFEEFQKAKNLRTFLAVWIDEVKGLRKNYYLSNKILVDLLPELPLLRVLNLSSYAINELPESIGSLKHLRYLNLSQTRIMHLPEQVGDLYNLQTILMRDCWHLRKLPNSFLKLKKLRPVDISGTPLEKMPLGIGELKNLQTLSKVIIEGANGFEITKLKNLKDLRGRLSIERLDRIKDAMDAKEANLFEKKNLNELEMKWGDVLDGARNETLEKEVLDQLKPCHEKLRRLKIVSYGGIEFPSWVGDPSFHRLEHVTIDSCKKCTSLPSLGQLSKLKELFVGGMDGVKDVGSELFGGGNNCGGDEFSSLEILSFENMSGWETWSINNGAFPCLRELFIRGCDDLVGVSVDALPSLRVLKVRKCGDGVLRSMVRAASSLTYLDMNKISGLTQLHGGVIECLGAVEHLKIWHCEELRYMWDSEIEASKILVNLRELEVFRCKNLVSLGEKKDVNCGSSLTSLRVIRIDGCHKIDHLGCPNSIEDLRVTFCDSITSISFPTGGQKLKHLNISRCPKLPEELLNNNSFSSIERLYIHDWLNLESFPDSSCLLHLSSLSIENCQNLESFPDLSCAVCLTSLRISSCENLESLPDLSCLVCLTSLGISDCENLELLPDLSCLVCLTELWIHSCKNLRSFPDDQLRTLTSLTHLHVYDCPSMEESFPRGVWPPNLIYVKIGGLKKPISKWGPQNFPTTLVEVELVGGPWEDVVSSTQFSHLLPSSLLALTLWKMNTLKSLSIGLQHLTSLRQLTIVECPVVRDLPETLLPQLLILFIHGCPKLEERCAKGRRGSYWPRISHLNFNH